MRFSVVVHAGCKLLYAVTLLISDFLTIYISQSSVDTCLRRGGIFKYDFITNLLLSLSVKSFENRWTFGEVRDKSMVSCFVTGSVHLVNASFQVKASATVSSTTNTRRALGRQLSLSTVSGYKIKLLRWQFAEYYLLTSAESTSQRNAKIWSLFVLTSRSHSVLMPFVHLTWNKIYAK